MYRILLVAAAPLILAYVVWRGLKDRLYFASLGERLGFLKASSIPTIPGGVWLHAVSVGEVLSSIQLIRSIRAQTQAPVYVSVSTLAGRAVADEKLDGLVERVFYAPLDYVFVVRRVLRKLKPQMVLIMETEIWPNLYREAWRAGCGLAVVNARISDRAYPRYVRFRWFFRAVLALPYKILAQSERDAQRYIGVGAPAQQVAVTGNLKYDFDPRAAKVPAEIQAFLDQRGARKIWIAASTMPPAEAGDIDEDDVVIRAFQQLENTLLILVPRKPERFDVVAEKLTAARIPFVRRSQLPAEPAAVLLLDSMGELAGLFPVADVVFMGGTLARRGGHNILEPAFFSRAVIVGPHMENFSDIAEKFAEARACVEISEPGELGRAVSDLLEDEDLRRSIGRRASDTAEAQRGATRRTMQSLAVLFDFCMPKWVPAATFMLAPLAKLWAAGARWDRGRKLARQRRLSTPVISVGALAMGGSGKTPLVAWMAARLRDRGLNVAILTRGYGRRSKEPVIVERGSSAGVSDTGDEPQIFIGSGTAHVGIGADRYAVGRQMEERFRPDVFLLDDGFQHAQLYRDLDVVLLDALDPLSNGVFPVGRLREPLSALERADIVVCTRAECRPSLPAIRSAVKSINPEARVFGSSVIALDWRDARSGATRPSGFFADKRVVAYCGLGNPWTFRHTLEGLGMTAVEWVILDDHEPIGPAVSRSAERNRAEAILTTEKDAVKIPAVGEVPVSVWYLRIELTVPDESAFLDAVLAAIGKPAEKV